MCEIYSGHESRLNSTFLIVRLSQLSLCFKKLSINFHPKNQQFHLHETNSRTQNVNLHVISIFEHKND